MNRLSLFLNSIRKTTADHISWEVLYARHPDSSERIITDPYERSTMVYVCISTTNRAISQVPLLVMRRTSSKPQNMISRKVMEVDDRVFLRRNNRYDPLIVIETKSNGGEDVWEQAGEDHPWQKLFDMPNYLTSAAQLKESITGNLWLDGNVWLIGYPPMRRTFPESLWVIQEDFMKPKRDKRTGQLLYWEYDPSKRGDFAAGPQREGIQIDLEDRIAHMKFWNPKDPILGLSPLKAGRTPMLGEWKAAKYSEKVFDNDGIISGAVSTDKYMSPTQIAQFRTDWNKEHQGYEKGHKLAILHNGLKYTSVAASNRDMEYMEYRRFTRDELLQIFGMKKAVISITDDLNYATSIGQKKEWWESTNIPITKLQESSINNHLLKEDPNLKIMYDLSTVKALQEDFDKKVETAGKLWAMGLAFDTINERLEMGFDKIPGGDTGYLPFSLAPVDGSGFEMEVEPEEIPEELPEEPIEERFQSIRRFLPKNEWHNRNIKLITVGKQPWEKRGEACWKRFDVRLRNIERPFEKKIQAVFFKMRKNILSILHHGEAGKSKSIVVIKDLRENLQKIDEYNFFVERDLLEKYTAGFYETSVITGAGSIIQELDLDMRFDLSSPLARDYILSKKMKITSVVDTIKRQTEVEIWLGFHLGEDTTLIEKRIKKVLGKANNRAKVIARTEVGGALNFGRYAQINQTSFKQKIWFTALDERVRNVGEGAEFDHTVMHGEKLQIGVNSQWNVGGEALDYPGDYKGSPGNIINCIANPLTPIFTSEGWRPVKDIKENDLVLTHRNRFKKVERIKNRRYQGNVVKLIPKGKKCNTVLVTPEHLFLMEDGSWKEASQIKMGEKINMLSGFCARCGKSIPYWKKYCTRACLSKDITDRQWKSKSHRENISRKTSMQLKKEYLAGTRNRFIAGEMARKIQKEKYGEGGYLGKMAKDIKFRKKIRDSINKKYGSTFNMLKKYAFPALGKVNNGISKIEKAMHKFLIKNNKKFIAQYSIGRRRIDFYIPEEKLFIECDGAQFHKDIKKERKRDLEILTKYPDHKIAHVTYGEKDKGTPKWEYFDLMALNHEKIYKHISIEIGEIQKWKLRKARRLYNFAVEEDESYIVKGFVSHNCRCIEIVDTAEI